MQGRKSAAAAAAAIGDLSRRTVSDVSLGARAV